ncbi:MAG: TolC family protein [Candidatus Alcyoniella australis]|nr:TolC family protein [Candidatus Alcyoniella australis]
MIRRKLPVVELLLIVAWIGVGCYHPNPAPAPRAASAIDVPSYHSEYAAGRTLDEQAAVELALQNDFSLDALARDIELARSQARVSGAFPDPELRVGQLSSHDLDGTLHSLELGLRFSTPYVGERAATRDADEARADLSQSELIAEQIDRSDWVRLGFSQIVRLEGLVEICHSEVQYRSQLLDLLRTQAAINERTNIELVNAELELFNAQQQLSKRENDLRTLQRSLAAAVGLETLPALEPVFEQRIELDREQLLSEAFAARPELLETSSNYRLSQARRHLERVRTIPWISFVEPSYRREYDEDNDETEHWAELRFGIALPIFNLGRVGVRAEELAMQRDLSRLRGIEGQIAIELDQALSEYRRLWDDNEQFAATLTRLEDQVRQTIELGRANPEADPLDLIDLQLELLQVRRARVEFRALLSQVRIDLLRAVGEIHSAQPPH